MPILMVVTALLLRVWLERRFDHANPADSLSLRGGIRSGWCSGCWRGHSA